jgi:hypothetical protein
MLAPRHRQECEGGAIVNKHVVEDPRDERLHAALCCESRTAPACDATIRDAARSLLGEFSATAPCRSWRLARVPPGQDRPATTRKLSSASSIAAP